MKNILFTLLIVSSCTLYLTAQNQANKPNRIAFISEKLALSSEEAEKFWPLLNDMESELKALKQELKKNKPEKKVSEMSDKEVEVLLDASFVHKQKELDIKKSYHDKFTSILPVKKVAKFYHLEHAFRKQKKQNQHKQGYPQGKKQHH